MPSHCLHLCGLTIVKENAQTLLFNFFSLPLSLSAHVIGHVGRLIDRLIDFCVVLTDVFISTQNFPLCVFEHVGVFGC